MARNLSIPDVNVRSIVGRVADWIIWACDLVITVGLVLLIAAAVLAKFNLVRIGFIPIADQNWLVYTAGAFWLYKGGKLR